MNIGCPRTVPEFQVKYVIRSKENATGAKKWKFMVTYPSLGKSNPGSLKYSASHPSVNGSIPSQPEANIN